MPTIDLDRRKTSFDEVELGFDEETAVNEAKRCVDCSICCECKACEGACQANAIDHTQRDRIVEIPVSAVIMCPGYDMVDKIRRSWDTINTPMLSHLWSMRGYSPPPVPAVDMSRGSVTESHPSELHLSSALAPVISNVKRTTAPRYAVCIP